MMYSATIHPLNNPLHGSICPSINPSMYLHVSIHNQSFVDLSNHPSTHQRLCKLKLQRLSYSYEYICMVHINKQSMIFPALAEII